MKQTRFKYRIVTAPHDKFAIEFTVERDVFKSGIWITLAPTFDTIEEAGACVREKLYRQNFKPIVVETF